MRDRVETLLAEGLRQYEAGDLEGAEVAWSGAYKLDPGNPAVLDMLKRLPNASILSDSSNVRRRMTPAKPGSPFVFLPPASAPPTPPTAPNPPMAAAPAGRPKSDPPTPVGRQSPKPRALEMTDRFSNVETNPANQSGSTPALELVPVNDSVPGAPMTVQTTRPRGSPAVECPGHPTRHPV